MESKATEIKEAVTKAYRNCADKNNFVIPAFKTVMTELWMFYLGRSKAQGRMESDALDDMKNTIVCAFRSCPLDVHQRSVSRYEEMFNAEVQNILEFAGSRSGGGNTISKGDTILHQSNGML